MKKNIHYLFIILFSAIICVSCFIALPFGPSGVPIIMQNMFVILASIILGGFNGFLSVSLFIICGAIGMPVFSGGRGGISHLLGPTGGFIFGYLPASIISGIIAGKVNNISENKAFASKVLKIAIASLLGFIIIYIPGVIWFMIVTKKTLSATLLACVVPYIPGDVIKIIATIPIAIKLRKVLSQYFV